MITIEQLDVEFEVDGDDAAVFERMFRAHIERWRRAEEQRHAGDQRLKKDRSIGGERDGEGR